MNVPQKVIDLVEVFDRDINHFKSHNYNETQLRREFLDPFFIALGWDVNNESGTFDAYKDVVHEDAIKVGSATKAPDYSFRVGGNRKFFVEAKKPAVNIYDNPEPAYQLRRYAWSAKLPLSILTDFEEFAVYDCRVKPIKGDKASTARNFFFTYRDYLTKWESICELFSKDAVWKGSLDRYADSKKLKRGTAEVDDDFLKEIENWRDILARNIALRNKQLTQRQLNEVVQKTIDRLIFLRICEDRGIETYGRLLGLINGACIYERLGQYFYQADQKYNSGLFHFSNERNQSSFPDELSLSLDIDDRVLKGIIKNLYYPDCPYEFSVFSADILGQVYERFLGKVIRLTAGHQAKIEEKPEVKKAGGVYYTPTYIVDYIVKNTVEKLLEKKTPKEVSEIKVLDPACGSGSFLIVAYQRLLDWHLLWYLENLLPLIKKGMSPSTKTIQDLLPEISSAASSKRKSRNEQHLPIIEIGPNDWRLTTAERKRILLNNIFGVDIDAQAVEVTKLSLLLKVLESESEQTLTPQLSLFQERALPDLGNNIKCGNTLIGSDFYTAGKLFLDEEERYKINVFDWKTEFPDIMIRGGFDAVIGNPPYVRQESLGDNKDYFKTRYDVYYGTADLYTYFIEKAVSLLRDGGYFSYIVANKWMRAKYGKPLRQWLANQNVEELIDFGDLPVFKSATTYPCVIRIQKRQEPLEEFAAINVQNLDFHDLNDTVSASKFTVKKSALEHSGWSLVDEKTQALLKKLKSKGIPLGEYVNGKIFYGIKTGLNEAFVTDKETRDRLIHDDPKSAELIKPFLLGRDIKRYQKPISDRYLILIPKGWTNLHKGNAKTPWLWFNESYPAIANHLNPFSVKAERRCDKGDYWWELRTCDYYEEFEKPKIVIPAITQRASYCFDTESFYSNDKTSIIPTDDLYVLGLLNSKCLDFVVHQIASTKQGGFYEYKPMYVSQLHIVNEHSMFTQKRESIERLVQQIMLYNIELNKRLTTNEQGFYNKQIELSDRMIDQLVFELYELTDDEIQLIENEGG
jgi:hypothetical protein